MDNRLPLTPRGLDLFYLFGAFNIATLGYFFLMKRRDGVGEKWTVWSKLRKKEKSNPLLRQHPEFELSSPKAHQTRRRTPPDLLPMSQQQSTFPRSGCVAVTRRAIMDSRPSPRRRTGAVRHLLLAAAVLVCSSQLLVVDANSWWWVYYLADHLCCTISFYNLLMCAEIWVITTHIRRLQADFFFNVDIFIPSAADVCASTRLTKRWMEISRLLMRLRFCVFWGLVLRRDVSVLWWGAGSEWNKCEGPVTIFILAEPQMALHGALSLYLQELLSATLVRDL